MHNAYISSTVYALRSKGSLSFSFNDYSYLLNERFERNPFHNISCSRCCCTCCSFSSHRLSIYPSCLYGLRQSSLLQWSASRRLILGGGDRYYQCFPIYGLDGGCNDLSCSLKERIVYNTSRRSEGRCCCMVEKGNSGMYDSSGFDDAEALLSLLSEEVDEDYVGSKRRNWSKYKRVDVKGKGGFSRREKNVGSYERVQLKKKEDDGGICNCGKKKNGGLRSLEGNTNHGFGSVRIESKEEESRRNKESGATLRGENGRLRKESSSSSYYSLSSSGDFDGDAEVHDKHTLLADESLSGYEDSGLKGEGRFDGQLIEKYKRHVDDIDEHEEVSEQRNTVVAGSVDREWGKKSEKKHSDRLGQETQHGRQSFQGHSRLVGIHRSSYEKISSCYSQFNDEAETSTLAVSSDKGARKQYARSGNQVVELSTSRRKFPEDKGNLVTHRDEVKTTPQSRNRIGSMGGNLDVDVNLVGEAKDEQQKTVICLAEKDCINRNTQKLKKVSQVQDFDSEKITIQQNQSEIGIIGEEENRTNVLSSLQEREETYRQANQQSIQQASARRKSQKGVKISEVYDCNIEQTSTMQSETRISNQVENTNLVSVSIPVSIKLHPQTGEKPPQRIQSGRGSYDVNDVALLHASEMERVTDSQQISERRLDQESDAKSIANLADKTREGIKQRKKLEDASTSQEPLSLDSQARIQKDNAEEVGQISSQIMLMPPPSQLLSRSSMRVELASGVESEKVSRTTSESGYSASDANSRKQPLALHQESYETNERTETHGEPLYFIANEDALGSADRLQRSSTHFVGEFIEMVRHEVSTSDTKKLKDGSETQLASEDDKNREKTSTQFSSEDFQLKEHEKRRSLGGSGAKGLSDEMWDVPESSSFKAPKREETEAATTTENANVKRSGRSLWNIIGDIVLLRWGSHSSSPSSAARSGRKISSNESAASESWFSTHETEHSKDRHEREKGLQPETTSDQLQVTTLSAPGQGNESDMLELTDRMREIEAEPASSTNMMESGSTSKGVSSSGDENLRWNEDGKSLQVLPSEMEIVESSSPSTARGETSTIFTQISDTRNTSGSKNGLGQQFTEVSGTEGNGGELKRRNLRRIAQVPKDRFDEWEEAYMLESEQRKLDEMYMREALLEAKKAADTWEVPVGAVLVQHGKIIARGYNLVEELRDSTAHAEMICIREASNQLRTWRLADTTLYVTLEPCPMCAGAILQSRISTLVWGAPNKLLGADGSWIRLFPDGDGGNNSGTSDKPAAPIHPFHPKMNIRRGILASDCADVMQQFFQLRRKKKEKQAEETPSSRLSSSHPSKLLKKMHDVFHIMFCL